MTSPARYCVIAPCRNEEKFMRRTLDCLAAQTVRPAALVVVDDGSTDATAAILTEYAARHDWIRVVTRVDRGRRAVGPGVIEAFYDGLRTLDLSRYEFLCKLDLDLDLPPRYFEVLLDRLNRDPRLGTCSGKPYFPAPDSGRLISEGCGDEMSVGMTKLYRTACFTQIGGFVREVMWDGIDCHRCRMLGWTARSWDEPELRFIHLRPMGSSQQSIWTGRMRHGFGQWFMGTGLLFMTASVISRMPHPPVVLGALATLWGYLRSMLRRLPRYNDMPFRRFLRRYQLESLVLGKRRAADRAQARCANLWSPEPTPDFAIPGCYTRPTPDPAVSSPGP